MDLVKKYGPIVRKPRKDIFEDIVDSIISQQLSVKAAATIYGRVKEKCKILTPQNILNVEDKILRECGISWNKVSYVKDLAAKTLDGTLQLDKLDKMTDQEVIDHLVMVKGIGRWTAEMILMFTLVRPDIFPVDDLGIQNAMSKLYKLNRKTKTFKSKLVAISNHWKPHRTLACWYLWKSLNNT